MYRFNILEMVEVWYIYISFILTLYLSIDLFKRKRKGDKRTISQAVAEVAAVKVLELV